MENFACRLHLLCMYHLNQFHASRTVVTPLSKKWVSTLYSAMDTSYHRPEPWLIIGLGNPGQRYKGTRHNVGFDMIDCIAEAEGIHMNIKHCKALCGKGHVGNAPVLLAKPQTYMDLVGESARPLAAYYRMPLHNVLVVFDDMELPCGVLRLERNGGHGCHIGVKSVIQAFRKNPDFVRLRIGIGKPPKPVDPRTYVLETFNMKAREKVDCGLKEGVEAVRLLTLKGFLHAAQQFNQEQKYKHRKVGYLDIFKNHP